MLISLIAALTVGASSGIPLILADVPVALEGPSTLEFGLIGAGVIVMYAVTARALWMRRQPIRRTNDDRALLLAAPTTTEPTAESAASEATPEVSRGAA